MQPLFRKISLFSGLALALLVLGFHAWAMTIGNRQDLPPTRLPARFTAAEFGPAGFAPLRLAGAWRVAIDDPRFGGVSALAMDKGQFLALTDSGTVIRFPRPGESGRALVHDLPAGPGSTRFKSHRDSEALARDPEGRGWWVAFERWHQLWLYDPDFRTASHRIDLGSKRWRRNLGIEGLVADGGSLTLFPESGREWLRLSGGKLRAYRLESRFGVVADAARTANGRVLLAMRKPGLSGLAKRLVIADLTEDGQLRLRTLARLRLGRTDNVEAIAVEQRADGTRLWLMTDNDFRPRAPTYLVALDLP